MSDKSWFDALSEILNKPLPGTEGKAQAPADRPVVFTDDDDDDSLLDKITDILSKPLPGTDASAIQVNRSGVATGLVGIPNRYMHSPVEIIEHCSRCLWLDEGVLKADGDPKGILGHYVDELQGSDELGRPAPAAAASEA